MSNSDVNLKGKRLVKTELLQRGAAKVTILRNTRKSLLKATSSKGNRTVALRVKVKRRGSWHAKINEAKPAGKPLDIKDVRDYWVFVDIGEKPRYWIVPEWWLLNNIHEEHEQYLQKHGGHRPVNDLSDHHGIKECRLDKWQNQWEILGVF